MSEFEANLARLRVAIATGKLPADLGEWALGRLLKTQPAAELRRQRTKLLRAAAAGINGTLWGKARAIRAQLEEFERLPGYRSHARFPQGSPAALVQAASRLAPQRTLTLRQLLNILR